MSQRLCIHVLRHTSGQVHTCVRTFKLRILQKKSSTEVLHSYPALFQWKMVPYDEYSFDLPYEKGVVFSGTGVRLWKALFLSGWLSGKARNVLMTFNERITCKNQGFALQENCTCFNAPQIICLLTLIGILPCTAFQHFLFFCELRL